MTQTVKARLDRLETRSGGGGRLLLVLEDVRGALTLGGVPWSEDQAGALDTVLVIRSFVEGSA